MYNLRAQEKTRGEEETTTEKRRRKVCECEKQGDIRFWGPHQLCFLWIDYYANEEYIFCEQKIKT